MGKIKVEGEEVKLELESPGDPPLDDPNPPST